MHCKCSLQNPPANLESVCTICQSPMMADFILIDSGLSQ
jgi:hypothetical protein